MSKSNKNSSNKCSAPAEAAGATCVLCHTRVSPEDMAVLKCGMVPIAHESTVHVACAEAYAASEANSFLKSERLPVICRLLGGGGASPNLVSNSTLKALGLQDMLEATGTERRKGSLTSTKGKMSDKYLRMAKNWANDESIAKKLLVAACPCDGCFLTIETYKTPQQDDSGAAASEQASKAPRKLHLLAMDGPCEEADEGRCVGTKQNGDACPRSANEHGGDAGAGLCRRCKEKTERIITIAATPATAKQDNMKRASTTGATKKKMTSKHEDGGIGTILKRTAKPVETCSSCGSKYHSKQIESSRKRGTSMCEKCIRPIINATAALAAENKAIGASARRTMGNEARGKEPRVEAQDKEVLRKPKQEIQKHEPALEDADNFEIEINFEVDESTDSETSTQGDEECAAAVESSTSSASKVTPEVAKTLAEAGPIINLLRENGVSDEMLLQLVELSLTSMEQIMSAHDDGLKKVGIKLGPRMRILKILSPLLLKFEDEKVKDVLERFRLGKYRARCAEEQIDIEALSFFAEEPDEALAKDLGVKPEDFEAFRATGRIANCQ